MNDTEIRSLKIEAEKAGLLQKYADNGHFRVGGEVHRVMSPAEDMMGGLRRFFTSKDSEAGAIRAAASISLLENQIKDDPRCLALVAGLKQGLESVGILTPTVTDVDKYKGREDLQKLQSLGLELVQKMSKEPFSTTQFLSDFDFLKQVKSGERNQFVFLTAAIGHALLDDEWVDELSPENKVLVAEDTRKRFMKPGERFEGYHFRRSDGMDEEGDRINLQYFMDNRNKEKTYRLSEASEFVVNSKPMRVMSNYEYVYFTHGEARDGVIAYAVYSKPRAK